MTDYPNDQSMAGGAIPVWIAGVAGSEDPVAAGDLLIGTKDGGFALNPLTAGTNITIKNGDDGTITINATGGGGGSGTVTQVDGKGTVNGITLTGSVTTAGDLTLGGTLANVNLTSQVTGTLPVANGGTGITNDPTVILIPFIIDGGGAAITTGIKGSLPPMPFAGTIQEVTLLGDQTGSIVVEVWACTYAAYDPPTTPTTANKINASTPPTITTAKKSVDSTLTGWTTAVAVNDILTFNVNSVTDLQRVTLGIKFKRT